MDLGVRHIRTAGKGSGSIELTLPTGLRDLVGLPCRITLRDGSRPDIVLQPDLQAAHAAFAAAWAAMAAILLSDAKPGDPAARHPNHVPALPLNAFGFGLQPRCGSDRPFLCWRDGLALANLHSPPPHSPPPHSAPPHSAQPHLATHKPVAPLDAAAVSRILAAFGHAIAPDLGIATMLAGGFGAACGTLAAGVPPSADWQESCDLAAAALHGRVQPGSALAAAGGALTAAFWLAAAPVLTAIAELFLGWTADPAGHAMLRAAWQRGRSIEMCGG